MSSFVHMEKTILKFLNTLFSGKFAEAERVLERIEKKAKSEEERRVLHMLRGVLNSYQSDDRDSLIYQVFMESQPTKAAKQIEEQLLQHVAAQYMDSDAYYATWLYILRNIKKITTPHRLRETA